MVLASLGWAGCATKAPDDLLCFEIQAAVAARAEACWEDTDAAVAFSEEVYAACGPPETVDPVLAQVLEGEGQRDLFECPLVVRNIACELAVDFGPDIAAWMSVSPVCRLMVDPS